MHRNVTCKNLIIGKGGGRDEPSVPSSGAHRDPNGSQEIFNCMHFRQKQREAPRTLRHLPGWHSQDSSGLVSVLLRGAVIQGKRFSVWIGGNKLAMIRGGGLRAWRKREVNEEWIQHGDCDFISNVYFHSSPLSTSLYS